MDKPAHVMGEGRMGGGGGVTVKQMMGMPLGAYW